LSISRTNGKGKMKYTGVHYFTNQEDYRKSDNNLATNFIFSFNCINKTDANKLNEELHGKVQQYNTDCFSCVTAACNTAFQKSKGRKLKTRRMFHGGMMN
jgi:hypothetical protein